MTLEDDIEDQLCDENDVQSISEDELYDLRHILRAQNFRESICLAVNAQQVAIEDVSSSLFANGVDNIMDSSLDSADLCECRNNVCQEPVRTTAVEDRLRDWEFASPFRSFEIDIDGINTYLGERFVTEANSVLGYVVEEISQTHKKTALVTGSDLSALNIFEVSLPDYLLGKIVSSINRILCSRNQKSTTVLEC
eukprot:TRINITY_DN425_c0_g1_i1.p2 TRINITY_DN425_c0_g1~~TRINITY_DN425_c0_g1_i1.p2  ORF type:complete len:195 (-),score=26.94 TRINITY_DN425_c0_g1_i1:4061-4645(-)